MFHSIRWRIAIPYMLLALGTLLVLGRIFSTEVRRSLLADLENALLAQARLIADQTALSLEAGADPAELDALARRWSDLIDGRVTLIDADGTVLGESDEDRARMQNHADRPEVQQAQATGTGSSIRRSVTLDQEMLYVAIAIEARGERAGTARIALPLSRIETSVDRLQRSILITTLIMTIITVLIALVIAERTARPVRRLTALAGRMASGDFSTRLSTNSQDEIGQLTQAFNRMAEELQEQMLSLRAERSRLAAILENLADGVIITDSFGQVELINPAAVRLLNTNEQSALGRSLASVVRYHQIIDIWTRCRNQNRGQVETVEIDRRKIFWQVIITAFQEANSKGFLVIIQDFSQIRQLEIVRRDFISNISHELRTPLASLKALSETLRDGALDDPLAARRFLDRIDTEVDALTQMVEELLELSRIEAGQVNLRLRPTSIADMLLPPLERLGPQIERSKQTLSVEIADDLPLIWVDVERMHQVVTNLVHNAIKFTPKRGQITVRAALGIDYDVPTSARQQGTLIGGPWPVIIVSVSDTGIGIPAKDLPRIFERFYKATPAHKRSGTGLGLSIARHLVLAHRGAIWAESEEGVGSTFYFSLPVMDPPLSKPANG